MSAVGALITIADLERALEGLGVHRVGILRVGEADPGAPPAEGGRTRWCVTAHTAPADACLTPDDWSYEDGASLDEALRNLVVRIRALVAARTGSPR